MNVITQQLVIFASVCIGLFVWGLLAKEKPDNAGKDRTASPNGGIQPRPPDDLQDIAHI